MSGHTFRVAMTADFYDDDGVAKFDELGLAVFDGHEHVEVSKFAQPRPVIEPEQLAGVHGVIVLSPRLVRASLLGVDDLLAVGRFGVGYDGVDVDACTDADVLALITSGAVDRPVAEATVGWMLALTHRVLVKDRLVREGRWEERSKYMGCELRERTLGVIGLGGIGRTLVELLRGFGMRPPLAYDPGLAPESFATLGVLSVELDELLRRADFVSIHCPLTERTRGLIGARELELMRPGSYLLNTARGGIVDEDALYDALRAGRIAGAAVDCFAEEPAAGPHRLGQLDNVLLAPHSIAWTEELFSAIGRMACQSMLDLSRGRIPHGVLNPELLARPSFRAKWERVIGPKRLDIVTP